MLKRVIKNQVKKTLHELRDNYFTSPFQSSSVQSIANTFNNTWLTLTNRPLSDTSDLGLWQDVAHNMLHGNFVYHVNGVNILEKVPAIPTNEFEYRKYGEIISRNLAKAILGSQQIGSQGTD